MILLAFFAFFHTSYASESYKIHGKSTGIELNLLKQTFDAQGRSEISYDDISISAKKISKDPSANKIIAEQDIRYVQGKFRVIANYLDLDLDKKISNVKNGRTEMNKFYLEAEDIEIKFPDKVTAKNAFVTTCSLKNPHFKIKAQHVDFYPDSKFVAYNGWIYIGEHFRLFPVPIYASYVVDKEDKAPLFPKITYDPAKGMMVIYGFDYQFLKNETVWGISNVNLGMLLNLEYSANRGFGVNKFKTIYSMMQNKNFNGEIVLADWVNAKTESKDTNLPNTTPGINYKPNKDAYGSSYKFSTKNQLKVDKGYLWKWKDAYIFGPSDSTVEIKITDSDLIKDSEGNYAVEQVRSKFNQYNIEINQKIWKLLDVKYKFLHIQSDKTVLDTLFAKADDKLEDSINEKEHIIDTKVENYLVLTHEDPKFHRFQFEYKRNYDLRPEKYSEGKSKNDIKDMYDINFKTYKLSARKIKEQKDVWASKNVSLKLSKEKENYVSEEVFNDSLEFTIGEYHLFNTNFVHKYNLGTFSKSHQRFHAPDADGLSGDDIYNTRLNRLDKDDQESYKSGKFSLGHKGINVTKYVVLIPEYGLKFTKYNTVDTNFMGYNKYFDTLTHSASLSTPIKLYNNIGNISRSIDLDIKLTPSVALSFVQGKSPKEQIQPVNTGKYGAKLDVTIGNVQNGYDFKWNRDVYAIDKYVKTSQFINSGYVKIGSQEFFKVTVDNKNDWEVKDSDPNNTFRQSYGTNWDYVKVDFEHRTSKSLTRDYKNKDIVTYSNNQLGYKGSIYVMGATAQYKYAESKRDDVKKAKEVSHSVENQIDLKYSKDFKEQKRKYEVNTSYQNEYDLVSKKYKDSKLEFSVLFEDRNWIREDDVLGGDIIDEEDEKILKKEDNFVDFNKDESEEIDRILGIFENKSEKPKKNIMDLGTDDKKVKFADRLIRFSSGIKITHDAGKMEDLGGFTFTNYQNSWKKFVFNAMFKFSTFIEVSFKMNKSRYDMSKQPFKEDTREFDIKFGLGQEGYEWYPGFHMKDNIADSVTESIYGTLDHNMHCTRMTLKLGKAMGREKTMVWMFGFEISITEFPEKAFGLDVKESSVENVKFGL